MPHSDTSSGSLFVTDIGTLAAVPPGPRRGAQMCAIPMIQNAAVLIRGGRIAWFGPQREAPPTNGAPVLSAGGGLVIPGLIDPHTHIPFAGDRSSEFVRRVAGESYLTIMQAGGGIRVTASAVRAASVDDLVRENLPRLERMLACGVTRVECKSGYGLLPEPELKQLQAIRELAERQPVTLDATYLGAHALPPEFEGRADEFIDTIGDPALLRRIASEGLARFCDVFCDRGAFTVEQSRRLLERAKAAGLEIKVHADELAQIGASVLAGELGAASADHLERIDDAGIAALARAGTVAVILPGTSFFLGIEHANARRLIDSGLPVALATDFNPGSCMIESLPFIMSIACCQLRLLPTEVLAACTANAAAALGVADETGAVAVGHAGDLVVLDIPTLDRWFYEPGRPHVAAVVKDGRVLETSRGLR
jgi:imidazolonepropionase